MLFLDRRTRKRAEENFSKMGELSLGARRVPYRRPVRRHEGWQATHQVARGALWREIGGYLY